MSAAWDGWFSHKANFQDACRLGRLQHPGHASKVSTRVAADVNLRLGLQCSRLAHMRLQALCVI
jgi:hypothetical protein